MKPDSSPLPFACRHICRGLLLGALLAASIEGRAQSGVDSVSASGPKPRLSIEPRLTVTETFTNNARLNGVNPQSDQITEFSPGIRIAGEGRRVKGYLDYSLSGATSAQGISGSSHHQSLNAAGTLEAVEKWAFLDLSGVISQQAISAFGTQSVDGTATSSNSNLSETSSFRFSPYVRGQFSDAANYEIRYSLLSSRTVSSAASNVVTRDWSFKLNGGTAFRRLQWTAEATRQSADYDAGRATEADQVRTSLSYAPHPQFSLTAIASLESNNYTSLDKESHSSAGWGARWSPSETTQLSLSRESRFLGESHQLSFQHRTPRTAWRLSDTRDVMILSNQATTASLGSAYDLFFNQFETVEPDPLKRADLVNAFLQANGINPGATVSRSYLTSAVSVQRRQDLSFAILGARDTITFFASRSEGSRLDTVLGVNDDFATSSVVRQHGLSVNYSHRLTPETSFNLTLSQQNSSGSSSLQDTSLRSFLFNVSTRLGVKTTATFGTRRVAFDSSTTPYNETAFTGNLNMRF